jgi:hypothetical protein
MRDGDVKRCDRCAFWVSQSNRCSLLGPKTPVLAQQVCGLFVKGKSMDRTNTVYYASLDPRVVGLGPGDTSCGNCAWGGGEVCEHPALEKFEIDNKGGCCNAWTRPADQTAQVEREMEVIEAASDKNRNWLRKEQPAQEAFDPSQHPRDERGRWISTGSGKFDDAAHALAYAGYKISKGTDAAVNHALVEAAGIKVSASPELQATTERALAHVVQDKRLGKVLAGVQVEVTELSGVYGTSRGGKIYIDSKTLKREGPGFGAVVIRHELEHTIMTQEKVPSGQQETRARERARAWGDERAAYMWKTNHADALGLKKAAGMQ